MRDVEVERLFSQGNKNKPFGFAQRHATQTELYVVLEGTGRIRIDGEPHTLAPLSSVLLEPERVRQVFNDTDADALWLVVGTPPELANTLEMTPELLAAIYPDGPKALPPELA